MMATKRNPIPLRGSVDHGRELRTAICKAMPKKHWATRKFLVLNTKLDSFCVASVCDSDWCDSLEYLVNLAEGISAMAST